MAPALGQARRNGVDSGQAGNLDGTPHGGIIGGSCATNAEGGVAVWAPVEAVLCERWR